MKPTPTIEEFCRTLKDFNLCGAGECNGELLLFAPNLEKAEVALREYNPPPLSTWSGLIQVTTFKATMPAPQGSHRKAKALASAELQAGDEVGPSGNDATGTLGGIVFDQKGDPHLLSARHSTPDTNVYEFESGRVVAAVAKPIGSLDPNGCSMDCKLAKVTGEAKAMKKLKFGKCGDVFEEQPRDAKRDEFVELCGAKAERKTKGKVVCPSFRCMLVEIDDVLYKFNNQILILSTDPQRSFAADGDSGGIVLRKNGNKLEALGLSFAASEDFKYTLAHPLTDIFCEIRRSAGLEVHF